MKCCSFHEKVNYAFYQGLNWCQVIPVLSILNLLLGIWIEFGANSEDYRWILLSLIHGKSFILSVVSHWVLAKRRNINAFEIDLALVSTEMYYLHIWEKKWETIISTFPAKILYFLASHEGIPYNFCFITNSLNPFNGELISPPEFKNLCSYLVYL